MKRQRQISDDGEQTDLKRITSQKLITPDLYDKLMNLTTLWPLDLLESRLLLHLVEFRNDYAQQNPNVDVTLKAFYKEEQCQIYNEIKESLSKTLINDIIIVITSYIDICHELEEQVIELFVPSQNKPICFCNDINCIFMNTIQKGSSETILNLSLHSHEDEYCSLVKTFCKVYGIIGLQYYLLKCATSPSLLISRAIRDALTAITL